MKTNHLNLLSASASLNVTFPINTSSWATSDMIMRLSPARQTQSSLASGVPDSSEYQREGHKQGHDWKDTIEQDYQTLGHRASIISPREGRPGLGTHGTGSAMISVRNMRQQKHFVTLNGDNVPYSGSVFVYSHYMDDKSVMSRPGPQ